MDDLTRAEALPEVSVLFGGIESGQSPEARRRCKQRRAVCREVHHLLRSGTKMTLRQLWYVLKTKHHSSMPLFSRYAQVSACVRFVCRAITVQSGVPCPREALGIIAAPRGSMTGCVSLLLPAQTVSLEALVYQVPGDTEAVRALRFCPRSRALCVLVVEKDSVFRRLVDDRFVGRLPCVLVTACGFPDVATRTLVGALVDSLKVPAFALTDYNPHGMLIFLSYKLGSETFASEVRASCPSLTWIGLRAADVGAEEDVAGGLPPDAFQPFTERDVAVCAGLRRRPCVACSPALLAEVCAMEERACKVEIEALYRRGLSSLGALLERKLRRIFCEPKNILRAASVLQAAIRRWLARRRRQARRFRRGPSFFEVLRASDAWCVRARARALEQDRRALEQLERGMRRRV